MPITIQNMLTAIIRFLFTQTYVKHLRVKDVSKGKVTTYNDCKAKLICIICDVFSLTKMRMPPQVDAVTTRMINFSKYLHFNNELVLHRQQLRVKKKIKFITCVDRKLIKMTPSEQMKLNAIKVYKFK